jgi:NhaA family Na+:H+ antiporter
MALIHRARTTFKRFFEWEASGGVVLMGAAALGMLTANSMFTADYIQTLEMKVGGLSVLHWINDGLMAIFFLLVGLEIKREMIGGELNSWPRRALPMIAAVGGMVVPALFFFALNWEHPDQWRGWAIPTATDIAFALGVLSLFGSRVPNSLKVFLTSLAIMDDLGAILIIAIFYASDLSWMYLGGAAATAAVLFALNAAGVTKLWIYLPLGLLLWGCMLFSGVHATLAGVIVAMAIPIDAKRSGAPSPLHMLEHALVPWVAFFVVPLFGFANAGVPLEGISLAMMFSPLPLGVIAGLFLGKQIGIMGSVFLAQRLKLAQLPVGATWREIYGVSLLCGIGFTMSLFIGLLAFPDAERDHLIKLGVLIGSLLSAIVGSFVLLMPKRRRAAAKVKPSRHTANRSSSEGDHRDAR